MLLGPDLKLIHAVLQAGVEGFFKARRIGVKASILYDEGRPIWELMEEMIRHNRLPSRAEIHLRSGHQIDEIYPEPIDVEMAAKYIVKRALTGQLLEKLDPLTEVETVGKDPFAVRDKLIEIYQETAWGLGHPLSINSREAVKKFRTAYAKAASRGDDLIGLSSPWTIMDLASLGLQPGELTILFAKRKVGKSWAVIAWAVHMWRNDLLPGEKILFVTMEMTELQIMRRMACVDLRLSWNDLREGKLDLHAKKRMDEWCDERIADADDPTKANIVFVTSKECKSAQDIGALTAEHQPKCVVVDSFYILGRQDGKSIYERVLGNVEKLKLDVAIPYDVPVLASTQLKGTLDKETLMADSDDAMGAKAIGDYADVTIGLFADQELMEADERYLRHMEAREFKGRGVHVNWNLERMDYSEIQELTSDYLEERRKASQAKKSGGGGGSKPSAQDIAAQLDTRDDGETLFV